MKHSEYIEVAKSLGIKVIEKSIVVGVVKAIPFFALGLPNTILLKLAAWLASIIADQVEMGIFFKYVDFRTDAQAKDFELAMINNHRIQLTGTKEDKDNAEKILMDSLRNLVSLRV